MSCSRHLWWLLHGLYLWHPHFIWEFYMIYLSYLKKVWPTLIFITLIAFIIFPGLWIQVFWLWTRIHGRISNVLVPIKLFYAMSLGTLPIKLEGQLIANVYHIPNVYQRHNTTYLLIISEQKSYVVSFISLCLHGFYPLWHMIYLIKNERQVKDVHIAFTLFEYFSHNMCNID